MIIKNIGKYNNIKLAKGIYLDNVKSSHRKGDTGISTKNTGKKWFYLPKGKAIFKAFDSYNASNIKANRVINEFICKELCSQLGIPSPNLDPATYDGMTGLLTYNVVSDNQKLWNANMFFDKARTDTYNNDLINYSSAIDLINKNGKGYYVNKDKMMKELYKMCVFDSLTMQTDRHISNIFFLENKLTHELTLAPLLDNEFAFFSIGLSKKVFFENKEYNIDDILHFYGQTYNKLRVVEKYRTSDEDETLKNLATIAKLDGEYKAILNDMLVKIDIHKAIQNVENLGFSIPDDYKEFMTFIVESVKHKIVEEYNNLDINQLHDFKSQHKNLFER